MIRRARAQLKSVEGFEPGQQLKADELFKVGDFVDVAGTSVGKGFQGAARLQSARVAASCRDVAAERENSGSAGYGLRSCITRAYLGPSPLQLPWQGAGYLKPCYTVWWVISPCLGTKPILAHLNQFHDSLA